MVVGKELKVVAAKAKAAEEKEQEVEEEKEKEKVAVDMVVVVVKVKVKEVEVKGLMAVVKGLMAVAAEEELQEVEMGLGVVVEGKGLMEAKVVVDWNVEKV